MTIWLVFAVMALGTAVYLAPSLFGDAPEEEDAELQSYFAQIDAVRANSDMPQQEVETTIATLQRQILARQEDQTSSSGRGASLFVLIGVMVIGFGVYAVQGRPDLVASDLERLPDPRLEQTQFFERQTAEQNGASLEDMMSVLEARLNTDRADDPQGWAIYARILARQGRFDAAIQAYDRLLVLTDNDPEVVSARQSVIDFQARSAAIPGPTAEDVEAAQTLSADDRAAMISGMVEGLAARLEVDPNDPEGWARLLRARIVLGDTDAIEADVATIRTVFEGNDLLIAEVLDVAGYTQQDR